MYLYTACITCFLRVDFINYVKSTTKSTIVYYTNPREVNENVVLDISTCQVSLLS